MSSVNIQCPLFWDNSDAPEHETICTDVTDDVFVSFQLASLIFLQAAITDHWMMLAVGGVG